MINRNSQNERKTLDEATRDELIYELKRRESISSIYIPNNEGATIKHSRGIVSLSGATNIFIIKPN